LAVVTDPPLAAAVEVPALLSVAHAGRKTRADARYCPGGPCCQRAYQERRRMEASTP
jgi:hypothetical protein